MAIITGLEITTPAPRPQPRAWGTALTSYPRLVGPEYEADAAGNARWLNGVSFTPFGCDVSAGFPFDPCDDDRTIEFDELGECTKFHPFLIEIAVKAPVRVVGEEELIAYVIAHSEVSRSSHLAAQVERAAYTASNPSLSSTATDLGNADQSLMGALHAVEEGLAAVLDGGAGIIHVPASILTLLAAGGGLRYDAAGIAFTPTGHMVVGDAGTLGVAPGDTDPTEGEVWIYGSGPVFYKLGDLTLRELTAQDTFNQPRNEILQQGQQIGLAIFETCSVVAAKIDTSDGGIIDQDGGGGGDALVVARTNLGNPRTIPASALVGYSLVNDDSQVSEVHFADTAGRMIDLNLAVGESVTYFPPQPIPCDSVIFTVTQGEVFGTLYFVAP